MNVLEWADRMNNLILQLDELERQAPQLTLGLITETDRPTCVITTELNNGVARLNLLTSVSDYPVFISIDKAKQLKDWFNSVL